MDFEQNRRKMMDELAKRKRETAVNRRISSAKKVSASGDFVPSESIGSGPRKPVVAVYGAESFFMRGFLAGLKSGNEVIYSTKHEDVIDYAIENDVDAVVIDMDAPTDWKMSTDVFTTIRMMKNDLPFFICTLSPNPVSVQTLTARGGVLLKKPVDVQQLSQMLQQMRG